MFPHRFFSSIGFPRTMQRSTTFLSRRENGSDLAGLLLFFSAPLPITSTTTDSLLCCLPSPIEWTNHRDEREGRTTWRSIPPFSPAPLHLVKQINQVTQGLISLHALGLNLLARQERERDLGPQRLSPATLSFRRWGDLKGFLAPRHFGYCDTVVPA